MPSALGATYKSGSPEVDPTKGIPVCYEESADTHHDHTHRGQDKSENGSQMALESVSRGVWHCVAQHFENAAQRSAKLPGTPIPRPVGSHFPIYLGLGVYGHGVCLHSLHSLRGFLLWAPQKESLCGLHRGIPFVGSTEGFPLWAPLIPFVEPYGEQPPDEF